MPIIDIAILITALTIIGFSFYLLYLTKDKIILLLWSIALSAVQVTIAQLHWELKWYVLSALPFYLFVLVYMLIKIRLRLNTALKRLDEREKEEARAARMGKIRSGTAEMAELYRSDPELKELNEFVGDYRDNDPV
jgi:NADH:ubiquinone oxidoreductase subunit 5 (subunit L)/multisubunit Na+/H+ antiporter MnhA subunit